MNLAEFLLARIAEDEAAADHAVIWQTANGMAWIGPTPAEATVLAISGHRLRAECDAKRRIVQGYSSLIDSGRHEQEQTLWWVCALLALPYANHPDFDDAWLS